VEWPVPEDDEVLVGIHATTVTRTDSGLRRAEFFISRFVTGLLRPKRKILGTELAGEIEAVGSAVTEFEVGERVFGVNGLRERGLGTFASAARRHATPRARRKPYPDWLEFHSARFRSPVTSLRTRSGVVRLEAGEGQTVDRVLSRTGRASGTGGSRFARTRGREDARTRESIAPRVGRRPRASSGCGWRSTTSSSRSRHSSPSGTTPRPRLRTCSGVKGGRLSSSRRWNVRNRCTM
jgi:hypothetical protein